MVCPASPGQRFVRLEPGTWCEPLAVTLVTLTYGEKESCLLQCLKSKSYRSIHILSSTQEPVNIHKARVRFYFYLFFNKNWNEKNRFFFSGAVWRLWPGDGAWWPGRWQASSRWPGGPGGSGNQLLLWQLYYHGSDLLPALSDYQKRGREINFKWQ